jgi:hypothetical protein
MSDTVSKTKVADGYSWKVDYMPDYGAVRCITIYNYRLTARRLGALVCSMTDQYQPMQMVIIDKTEKESNE